MRFVKRVRDADLNSSVADDDPLAGIANLFDVSVAFIVALLIALFSLMASGDLLNPDSSVTMIKQNDKGETEIITKRGTEITVQKVTDQSMAGRGTRLGTAYRLANGQVVYVPDSASVQSETSQTNESGQRP